ncbi:MAG: hypothetical protein KIT00_00980 [Rhodospirillales bacterium]|nr:hypothetical protein [Rhodospirillales bacterium]
MLASAAQTLNTSPSAETLSFRCFDLTIGIRSDNTQVVDAVIQRLPSCWQQGEPQTFDAVFELTQNRGESGAGAVDAWTLSMDGKMLLCTADEALLLRSFENALHLAVSAYSRRYVFVRAGVVRHGETVIVLPGKDGCGKTMLVSALLRAGASYFSDAFAVFDPNGLAHPYPVPLTVTATPDGDPESVAVSYQHHYQPPPAPGPCAIGLIATLDYRPGASWRVDASTPKEAAVALLSNSLFVGAAPERSLRAIAAACVGIDALKGERGDADDAARRLLAHQYDPHER